MVLKSNSNKYKKKSKKNALETGYEFALSFFELGKAHRAENRQKQNFEQFMIFDKFHEIDFAKEGVPAPKRKEMTEEFVRLVVYPAYESGFHGTPLF